MILGFIAFVETLKLIGKKKFFIYLSICTLIDLIISTLLWVDDAFVFVENVSYERFVLLRSVSVVFFIIFVFKYYSIGETRNKSNEICTYIMLALVAISIITGGLGVYGKMTFIMNLSDISYWSYSLVRFFYIIRQE